MKKVAHDVYKILDLVIRHGAETFCANIGAELVEVKVERDVNPTADCWFFDTTFKLRANGKLYEAYANFMSEANPMVCTRLKNSAYITLADIEQMSDYLYGRFYDDFDDFNTIEEWAFWNEING